MKFKVPALLATGRSGSAPVSLDAAAAINRMGGSRLRRRGLAGIEGGKMVDTAKKIGRPLRKGSDLDAAREAILNGCSMYETARLSGISMYIFRRLQKELRQGHDLSRTTARKGRRKRILVFE